MNINSVGTSPLSSLVNTNASQNTQSSSSVPPAGNAAASANISKRGQLLQKLQQLQQQDPQQFTQIVSQMAESLQQVANQSGDANGMTANLAAALKNAASTGDLSALQSALQPQGVALATQPATTNPSTLGTSQAQGPAEHHGHHHHGGGGAIAAAFSTALNAVDSALQSGSTESTATTSTTAG